jgi:hypothetical protein
MGEREYQAGFFCEFGVFDAVGSHLEGDESCTTPKSRDAEDLEDHMRNALRLMMIVVLALCGFALAGRFARSAEAARSGLQTAAGADAMRDAMVAQERAGMDALKSGDVAGFGSSVGEEAVFVDDHGPATKAEVMRNVGGFRLIDYSMEDVRLVRVSDTAGMIVYKLTEHGTSHGHEFSATVYISTLYVERGGKWVSLFSQETGARPVAPKPAAAS